MTATYNFDANLINASHDKELENAKKEWKFICEENRNVADGLCICQRKVKNVIYMYNIKTKNTICVGSTCHKKFNMGNEKLSEDLTNIFKKKLEKGEYLIIDNIVSYSTSIEDELIEFFQNKMNINSIYILTTLSKEINILIKDYDLQYLHDIYIKICDKINQMCEKRKKDEESKIYSVKEFYRNYMPGMGTDYYEKTKYYCDSLEKCNEYISKRPIVGVVQYSGYGYTTCEDIYLKYEILCKNEIIKTIGEEVYEKYKEYIC